MITTILLTTSLAAGPAMADHDGKNLLNRENLGGAIGAAIGGFAGNKIVDGKGQSAATAAGAVGGFLVGKNVAHNYGGGEYRSSGYSSRGKHGPSKKSYSQGRQQRGYESYGHRQPQLNRINATFVAKTTSNVRAGPSTRYSITDRLYRHESVHVIGKVPNRNWFMIRAHGRQGFVYAPLLKRPHHGYRDNYRSGGYQSGSSRRAWHR